MPLPGAPGTPAPRPKISLGPKLGPAPGARIPPKIQVAVQGDKIAVVTILDSHILDENNINEIGRQLLDLVKKQYMIKMVIDMGEVKYLSSAVLRQFISLYKAIQEEKGALKLCRVRPEIREVFKITQLDKMIEIHDALVGAVNSFKKKGWGFLQR
jgi:anti-sigma B factor antagonist